MADKANVLLVGCGGIGTISALNLEIGGRATVTAVLRSNYDAVQAKGFHIRSVDHGLIENFRPTASMLTWQPGIICSLHVIADFICS